jgi:hypothetical protein
VVRHTTVPNLSMPRIRVPHISPRFCGEMWENPLLRPQNYLGFVSHLGFVSRRGLHCKGPHNSHISPQKRSEIWGTRSRGRARCYYLAPICASASTTVPSHPNSWQGRMLLPSRQFVHQSVQGEHDGYAKKRP